MCSIASVGTNVLHVAQGHRIGKTAKPPDSQVQCPFPTTAVTPLLNPWPLRGLLDDDLRFGDLERWIHRTDSDTRPTLSPSLPTFQQILHSMWLTPESKPGDPGRQNHAFVT